MSDEGGSMEERLAKVLSSGADWDRTPTNIPGVMILRMPQYKSRPPTLALEINPVDVSGSTTKKRALMIRSASELAEIAKIIANDDLARLAEAMDSVNPASMSSKQSANVFRV